MDSSVTSPPDHGSMPNEPNAAQLGAIEFLIRNFGNAAYVVVLLAVYLTGFISLYMKCQILIDDKNFIICHLVTNYICQDRILID